MPNDTPRDIGMDMFQKRKEKIERAEVKRDVGMELFNKRKNGNGSSQDEGATSLPVKPKERPPVPAKTDVGKKLFNKLKNESSTNGNGQNFNQIEGATSLPVKLNKPKSNNLIETIEPGTTTQEHQNQEESEPNPDRANAKPPTVLPKKKGKISKTLGTVNNFFQREKK